MRNSRDPRWSRDDAAKTTQHMKTNQTKLVSPVGSIAEPDYAQLVTVGFTRTARHFGIEVNPLFPDRVCAIAFTNGVLFQSWHPDEVDRLVGKLETSISVPPLDLPWAATQLAVALPKGPADMAALCNALAPLVYSGIVTPRCDDELPEALGRSILLGLKLGALQPALADCIVTWLKRVPHEQAFLVSRLSAWSAHDDLPFAEPIIEFASTYYRNLQRIEDLVCGGLHDAWKAARYWPDPWDLSAWVYHGFARGRRLGLSDNKEARAVIEELPAGERDRTVRIYRDTAIGAGGDGETFDILAATLRYFGLAHDGLLSRFHCQRLYPRLLVVRAYEYAVWIGLLAALPLELSRLDVADRKETI
jgi:hypothetical protein